MRSNGPHRLSAALALAFAEMPAEEREQMERVKEAVCAIPIMMVPTEPIEVRDVWHLGAGIGAEMSDEPNKIVIDLSKAATFQEAEQVECEDQCSACRRNKPSPGMKSCASCRILRNAKDRRNYQKAQAETK